MSLLDLGLLEPGLAAKLLDVRKLQQLLIASMGASKNGGVLFETFAGLQNKDYSIMGSILGSLCLFLEKTTTLWVNHFPTLKNSNPAAHEPLTTLDTKSLHVPRYHVRWELWYYSALLPHITLGRKRILYT